MNLGQGAALQTGFEYALAVPDMRWVATFDADGQHQTNDVLAMLDLARADGIDVVFGSASWTTAPSPAALKKLVLRMAVGYTNLTTKTRLATMPTAGSGCSPAMWWAASSPQNRMAHASGSSPRSALDVRYGESPVHILYTDYSRPRDSPCGTPSTSWPN